MIIEPPSDKFCTDPDSTIERSSASSREPEESTSNAPNTAFTIAFGAIWPVIARSDVSNSDRERVPSPFKSYFVNRVSAV